MIPLENTSLLTYTAEDEDGNEEFFALMIEKSKEESFDIDVFMKDLNDIETEDDDALEEAILDVMDKYSVIEMFDQEDIDELTEEGRIDPEDLHSSLYEVIVEEKEEE